MPWSVYNSNGKLLQSLAITDDSIVEGKLDVSNAPTNGYFLQAQSGEGGGLTWAAAGGGSLTFIGQTIASGSPTYLTVDGLDDPAFDAYLVVGSELQPAVNTAQLQIRFGDSNGIDGDSSDYSYSIEYLQAGSTSHTQYSSNGASFINVANYVGNSSTYGCGFHAVVYCSGGGSTLRPVISGSSVSLYATNTVGGTFIGARKDYIAFDRIALVWNSGNHSVGRLAVWGLKHA